METKIEAHLVDHVTLGVPTFIPHVTIDLNELLQNSAVATSALRSKAGGVVVVTVYVAFMLVVRILRSKERGAY